ncbi:sigma-70 family RNA polymerase sigma factor [Streptomyces polygonati]|uniref:Sigma-70 family RNA polymerase sigma factor n=1 Tax=Streptomyces polygonati TaxID=1617087 RepID=A0ABV8HXW3_9ACTN
MNDDVPDQAAAAPHSAPPVGALKALPLDFEAFYLGHQEAFHDYAEVTLGHREEAEEAVHRGFLEILGNWTELLADGNLEQQAWAIMRRLVSRQLEADGRPPALVINGPILRALHTAQALDSARDRLHLMDSSRGLYAAIAQLPTRQFDVIVLRFVLGYRTTHIAWLLGLKNERTVDYHLRRAKERLRVQLGLPAETTRKGARQ